MSSKKFIPFKDFQSDQIQRSCCKIFTAHYACRNSDLNLTRTTNGVIFQIINLLIESWGVRLTCLDCNLKTLFRLHRCICDIALLVWKRRSFCKERRFEAYYASNIGWKNGPIINLDAGRFSFQERYFVYITVELLYNEPLYNEVPGTTINYFLTRPKIVKCMRGGMKTELP